MKGDTAITNVRSMVRMRPARRTEAGRDVILSGLDTLRRFHDNGDLQRDMIDYVEGKIAVASEYLDAPAELVEEAESIVVDMRALTGKKFHDALKRLDKLLSAPAYP